MFRTQAEPFNKYFILDTNSKCAIRTACALVFAALIVFYFHFNEPYWALVSVVLLTNPIVSTTIDKINMRAAGTVVGALLGFVLAGLTVNHLSLYLLTLFIVIFCSVYLSFFQIIHMPMSFLGSQFF